MCAKILLYVADSHLKSSNRARFLKKKCYSIF